MRGRSRSRDRKPRSGSAEKDDKRRASVDKNKENRGRSRDGTPRQTEAGKKRREATPRALRIHIGRLTRNVTKEHIVEIFSCFGDVKNVEFPIDRLNCVGRGHCYVDYGDPDHAELAMKNMDGGQIDGQEITAAPILMLKTRPQQQPMRRMSPLRGGGRPMNNRWRGGGGGGGGGRRRSPPRRNNSPRRRNRSRSPINRRRQRRSSSGSSR